MSKLTVVTDEYVENLRSQLQAERARAELAEKRLAIAVDTLGKYGDSDNWMTGRSDYDDLWFGWSKDDLKYDGHHLAYNGYCLAKRTLREIAEMKEGE